MPARGGSSKPQATSRRPTNKRYAERKWDELKEEEGSWLKRLGDESEIDVEALVELCKQILKAAHKDLRGGYGVETD